jgi:hypothetical protein
MKKYLFIVLLISGCTIVPPRPYDSGLYDHYVNATVTIFNTIPKCSDQSAVVNGTRTALTSLDDAIFYAKYRNEPQLVEATSLIVKDLNQLLVAYDSTTTPNEYYCRIKLQTTEESLINILEAIGGKPQ